jgi:hypothetical protein
MQYNRYAKKLQNKIKKLNLNYEETGELLVCLYLYGGCPEEDCAKLFEFTLDSIIDYLKYEQIYDYKICNKCEKLKERNDIEFKPQKGQKNTKICTECKKINRKKYNKNNFKYIQEYNKNYYSENKENQKLYYENNKEKIIKQQLIYYSENKDKRKLYYKNNKNSIQIKKQQYNKNYNLKNKKQQKLYREENKEKRKEYMENYYNNNKEKLKNYSIEYNVNNKEKIKEFMKKYQKNLASEDLVKKLELYEEIKGNQIKCRYCGDWYTPTVMEVHNRLNGISNNDTGYIYCSEECKEACPIFRKQLYSKGFKKASSREVNPVLRQLVFERDQYTCQKCFTHKDKLNCPLHCHHITPYIDSPMEGNDPENCITLCKDCHKEVHQIPGCGYNELKCG